MSNYQQSVTSVERSLIDLGFGSPERTIMETKSQKSVLVDVYELVKVFHRAKRKEAG